MATCGDDLIEFIDCASISISFNVMGIATVAYTIVRNNISIEENGPFVTLPCEYPSEYFQAGTRTFYGYITGIAMNQITNTDWYENHVTWTATTDPPTV